MAGTLRQAMVFLGLADDGYDEAEQEHRRPSRADRREDPQTDTHEVVSPRAARRQPQGSHTPEWDEEEVEPREAARRPEYYEAEDEDDFLDAAPHRTEPVRRSSSRGDAVRTEGEDSSRELVQSPSRAVHRREEYRAPVTPINRAAAQSESDNELRRITTIHPRSYNDAKVIGESFRSSIPVIMNVTDMDVAEAKRLVDFSSGLTFALNGSIERVTEQVFLLTPANLEVLASEDVEAHAAAADEGVFNQN